MVTYLVSGAHDIRPSHENLRASGRTVRFNDEVSEHAAAAILPDSQCVVVAHGQANGTITWFRSVSGESAPWLWVGMEAPPAGARVYLYACSAGTALAEFLTDCECFGHSDTVPMPMGDATEIVLRYLDEVDRVVSDNLLSAADWQKELGKYVNTAYADEAENPTSLLGVPLLLMLRRSLGYVDG